MHFRKFLFSILLILYCSVNPINKGKETDALKVDLVFAQSITQTSVEIIWQCSSASKGFVSIGDLGIENPQIIPLKQKIHFYKFSNLVPAKIYSYQAGCIGEKKALFLVQRFRTLANPIIPPPLTIPKEPLPLPTALPPSVSLPTIEKEPESSIVQQEPLPIPKEPYIQSIVLNRSIWLVGGMGIGNTPASGIDLYDPVTDLWYENVTTVPTPRAYSGVVSLNQKIYVIAGIANPGSFVVSNLVEEYDPYNNSWRTLSPAPVSIQGAVAAVSGNSIFLLGGSVTLSSAASIPNILYRFTPNSGSGTWTTITSASAIPARMDLSGCSVDGTIFFNMGRDTTGTAQFSSDAYIPSANTTTTLGEGNFSLSRFGTSSACYRPKATDPFPSDAPAIFLAGGSTLGNSNQPASTILSSNRFDYYLTPSGSNTVVTGPNLPANLYSPASEISYENRRLYVFGGATVVNVPTSAVYSILLSNPSVGPWDTLIKPMPVARYGHQAIILNR